MQRVLFCDTLRTGNGTDFTHHIQGFKLQGLNPYHKNQSRQVTSLTSIKRVYDFYFIDEPTPQGYQPTMHAQ